MNPAHAKFLHDHLDLTLRGLDAPAPNYRGKVRDVYVRDDEVLLVATDRISAFDVVLGTVPMKGQLLTEQATFWLQTAQSIVPTHMIERVDAQAMRCKKARALPVEFVVRGYLAGSLLREPTSSRGLAYGLQLDPHQAPFTPFAHPVITPTTKEAVGVHDQPCSLADLVSSGRVSQKHLERGVEIALALYALGSGFAESHGLLLVDTKYELGIIDDEVVLIDELHTADSSRFWIKATYAERLAHGDAPEMLDKERLRRWLLSQGYSGEGTPPVLSADVRIDLAANYWDLTERVLGRPYAPVPGDASARVATCVRAFLGSQT
jgi:phosphoribosylaminoimidazole-succinocarboxamide synthase